jgi:hypothetical protein
MFRNANLVDYLQKGPHKVWKVWKTNFFQCLDHNNVGVAIEKKGEYELARDAHVASIAYM